MNASDDVDLKIRDLKDSWQRSQEPRACPRCGENMTRSETSTGSVAWTCPKCRKTVYQGLGEFDFMPRGKKIGKYFLHGIAYTLISLAIFFGWIFVGFTLILLGSLIGLILAFILPILIVGAVNTIVSSLIWGFSMKTSLGSIFLHGLVLCIAFVAIGLVTILPIYSLEQNWIYVVLLQIGFCFANGFIGEKVAEVWTE